MTTPLVTVICLCYNHERFINEAIESVINQNYTSIEVIIVDDGSTDNSVNQIQLLASQFPQIHLEILPKNIGNCAAFNLGAKLAKGKYLIDFATDDVMLPNRIEEQVIFFEKQNENVGVIFSNAILIDEIGNEIRNHSSENEIIPQGDIFDVVLRKYFICPPTIMFKKSVFDSINGYDESLAYEDFDFWVRSSRKYHYAYLNKVLTKRRIVKKSLAHSFQKDEIMTNSTRLVCEKAYILCENDIEFASLKIRINYELLFAFRKRHWKTVISYSSLVAKLYSNSFRNQLLITLAKFFKTLNL